MDFEVGAVNHDLLGRPVFCGQAGEDAVEDAHTGPANEPVVERFVRTVDFGGIPPSQTIANDVDYPTDHTQVIHALGATRLRKVGFNAL